MKILGVITARGGSKGIPGKNIKPLAGKPLIAYTIEAAKESGVFDRVILSTDDDKIAEVARSYDCEVPFMRPAELAEDATPHLPVMQHALMRLQDYEGYKPDAVAILQPTAPLRRARHLREAVELFFKTGADSVVSVCEVPGHYNPHWQFRMGDGGRLSLFTGEEISAVIRRRQDLPATYARNGAIYLFKTDFLFDPINPNFYGVHAVGYLMNPEESVNIDSMEDWIEAEKQLGGKKRT